jgi:uncharacterized protein with FMN-binding domain
LPSKSHNSNQRQRRERAKKEYADGGYIGADARPHPRVGADAYMHPRGRAG